MRLKTRPIKVKYPSELEPQFETILDDELGAQVGTFGETTLGKKSQTSVSSIKKPL